MRTVKISKEKLLAKLRENREDHREIFEEALEGWKIKVIENLEQAVKEAKASR